MSWHVASYTGSIAGTANTDLPADPTDGWLTIQNGHYVLPQPMKLLGTLAIGALLVRARYDAPSMRFFGNPFMRPLVGAATAGDDPSFDFEYQHPFYLPPGEEIAVQVTNSGAGPTRTSVFPFLSTGIDPIPGGNIYNVRITSSTAAVANAWTNLTFAFDSPLPSSAYAMVLSELQSTTGIAHRWFFQNQLWRPGFPSLTTEASGMNRRFYDYPFGRMGAFTNTAPPILQTWCGAADAAHVGYVSLIPLSGGSQVTSPMTQPFLTL